MIWRQMSSATASGRLTWVVTQVVRVSSRFMAAPCPVDDRSCPGRWQGRGGQPQPVPYGARGQVQCGGDLGAGQAAGRGQQQDRALLFGKASDRLGEHREAFGGDHRGAGRRVGAGGLRPQPCDCQEQPAGQAQPCPRRRRQRPARLPGRPDQVGLFAQRLIMHRHQLVQVHHPQAPSGIALLPGTTDAGAKCWGRIRIYALATPRAAAE